MLERKEDGNEAYKMLPSTRTHTAIQLCWRRYVLSTNHKDIGTMYFVFAISAGFLGAIISIAIRTELRVRYT